NSFSDSVAERSPEKESHCFCGAARGVSVRSPAVAHAIAHFGARGELTPASSLQLDAVQPSRAFARLAAPTFCGISLLTEWLAALRRVEGYAWCFQPRGASRPGSTCWPRAALIVAATAQPCAPGRCSAASRIEWFVCREHSAE